MPERARSEGRRKVAVPYDVSHVAVPSGEDVPPDAVNAEGACCDGAYGTPEAQTQPKPSAIL